jgi:hypothetical protein
MGQPLGGMTRRAVSASGRVRLRATRWALAGSAMVVVCTMAAAGPALARVIGSSADGTLSHVTSQLSVVEATAPPDPASGRIFTVAGGGTRAAADGVPATDARLRVAQVVALDQGGLALVHDAGKEDQLYRVGEDGRLRRVPLPLVQITTDYGTGPARVIDLDARPDGTLLLALADRVWQLAPAAGTWEPLPAFARGPLPNIEIDTLAATADGRTLAAGEDPKHNGLVWLLAQDGQPQARYGPPTPSDDDVHPIGLVAFPDGGFAFNWYTSGAIVRRDASGAFRRFTDGVCCQGDLGALPDGSIVRAAGMLTLTPAVGRPHVAVGDTPGLGMGDGGPTRTALLDARLVDVRTDGSLLVGDAARADPRGPINRTAFRWGGRAIITEASEFDVGFDEASLVRFAGDGAPGVPTVALLPATYHTLRGGTVTYHTSFAGRAALTIRAGRRTVLRKSASVGAGEGHLRLPARLPPDDYRVELRVTDGRTVASHRLAVSLVETLSRRRALRLARQLAQSRSEGGDADAGSFRQATGCRRQSVKRFACAERFVGYSGDVYRTRCDATLIVRLRRDGARAYPVHDLDRCRRLPRATGAR